MNGVNLIPMSRRRSRARRARAKLWGAITIVCAIGWGIAYGALWSAWNVGSNDLAADSEKVARDISAAQRLEKTYQAKVREETAAAAAAREVSVQPDWGVLLEFVAGRLGSEAALDSVRLEPVKPAAPASPPPGKVAKGAPPVAPERKGLYTLVLTGVARTQDAASEVAIHLKETDLFEGVSLVETHRGKFMGGEAVSFRIDCAIAGAGGGE